MDDGAGILEKNLMVEENPESDTSFKTYIEFFLTNGLAPLPRNRKSRITLLPLVSTVSGQSS